jgi:putative transposase
MCMKLAIRYAERLADAGALASIGSVGDSFDCEDVSYRQAA